MSTTHKIDAHVYAMCGSLENPIVLNRDDQMDAIFAYVCPVTVEFEVPEGWDPRTAQVAALRKHKDDVLAEAQAKATDIDRRISELLAIEHSAPPSSTADVLTDIPF